MELKLIRLTKTFGSKTAVNDLTLTLSNGVYGLLGANGAGKTTLMRLLCGLQRPTSGKITLNGKNIAGLGERYQNLLGYLPQQFGYYPDFTAYDFLLYISALKGLGEAAARKKSAALLEAVGLSAERKQRIKTFSGGMKQRLGIAQAMLNDPRILILDEPTAGLDPKERVRFRNLISAFARDRIVILSTHIVSDVEYIAENIILMKSGEILHFGNPQEITTELNGQVWEFAVPASQAERYADAFDTSNLRHTDSGKTILRVIADRPPAAHAVQVLPNLEDLYLFYSRETASQTAMFTQRLRGAAEQTNMLTQKFGGSSCRSNMLTHKFEDNTGPHHAFRTDRSETEMEYKISDRTNCNRIMNHKGGIKE